MSERRGRSGGPAGALPDSPTRDLVVGLDLGTSALKGVVLGAGGIGDAARTQASYPTDRSLPGMAEQDPRDWLRALQRVLRELAAATDVARWAGIGLTAMLPTLVVVGDDGEPLGPAVTWEDTRAEPQGDDLRRAVGDDELYRTTGQRLDGRYLLPMWMRVTGGAATPALRAASGRAASAARPLAAKDYLFRWLTGVTATDPSTATGFGCYGIEAGDWLPGIAAACGSPALPPVTPATVSFPLSAAAFRRLKLPGLASRPGQLPVVLGAADSVCAAPALGLERSGDVAYVCGTSTVILGLSRRPLRDPQCRFLVTPMATSSHFGLEMDLVSTGSAMAWLARLLRLGREGEARLMALAADAPEGAGGARFLPFLGHGEQGARWDPSLSGVAFGLGLEHGAPELARSLVEGIVLESRRCLEVLVDTGLPRGPLHATGHMVATPFFRRLLADASGRRVLAVSGDLPASATGAALVAASALGIDLPETSAATMHVTEPDRSPERRRWWNARAEEHERGVAQLGGLTRQASA